jgi:NAD(P)-dependent dehydrogenase (short-subunit alcohol dehydrogenase family)
MKFEDKVVVITGAGQGIGRALAMAYADQKAIVILIDKNEDKLMSVAEDIGNIGGKAITYPFDLTDTNAIIETFNHIKNNTGRIDVLINNAGLGITKSIDELTIEEWDYVMNTNLRGTFICSREASQIMRENSGGSIVNIASTRALMSEPDTFPYSASKGGILSLTHSLAVSLGKYKIRVNTISPGWIETGDYSRLRTKDHDQHPAKRVGKPEDIVKACFYLTDPDNDFVTGTNLVVDGGMTINMIYEA